MQDRLQSTVMWQMQDVANAGKAIVYSDVANAGCGKRRMWQMQDRLQSTVMWQMQDVANAGKAIVYSDVANAGCGKCRTGYNL